MKLHPILAGGINALLPGLGYLLIDERRVFGWLLMAGSIACIILSFTEPAFISHPFIVSESAGGKFLEIIWYICFAGAYGYDAWSLAKAKQDTGTSTEKYVPVPMDTPPSNGSLDQS